MDCRQLQQEIYIWCSLSCIIHETGNVSTSHIVKLLLSLSLPSKPEFGTLVFFEAFLYGCHVQVEPCFRLAAMLESHRPHILFLIIGLVYVRLAKSMSPRLTEAL